jgi:toxin YxiD
MLGQDGTQFEAKTMWGDKNSPARVDVENFDPGGRPGTLHYQNENGEKFQFNVNDSKFYQYNSVTKEYDVLAPKKVNKLLEIKAIQKAIDKGLKYLGESPIFNNK